MIYYKLVYLSVFAHLEVLYDCFLLQENYEQCGDQAGGVL